VKAHSLIRALGIVALGAMLVACTAGQPPNGSAPRTFGVQRFQTGVLPDAASRQTLYVANADSGASGNALYGYSLRHLRLTYYTTTGLNFPQGITTDGSGAVYVANTYGYNILKFEPPATSPVQRIKDSGFRPDDVAVDANANIWVANFCTKTPTCAPGNVREYSAAGDLLLTITCPNLERYYFLAVDQRNNVVVAGESHSTGGAAGEIVHGTSSCAPLKAIVVAFPGGVQFTKDGDLTVTDQVYSVMYTYARPKFETLLHTTDLLNIPSPVENAFEKGDSFVWYSVAGYNGVYQFAYPSGGYATNSLSGFSFPTGVAIGPRPRR
jgi:hypothetical protein